MGPLHALKLLAVLLSWAKQLLGQQVIVNHFRLLLLPVLSFYCFYFLAAQEGVGLLQSWVELANFHFSFLVIIICIYLPVNVLPLVLELVLCGLSHRWSLWLGRVGFVIRLLRNNTSALMRYRLIIFRLMRNIFLVEDPGTSELRLGVIKWIPMR